jgi:formate dehydrogenase maturation protein FdhE
VPGRRAYTDAEVEAAVQALTDPAQLEQAQRLVVENAPTLQRILNIALNEADWFGSAHHAQVLEAAGKADIEERLQAVQTLLAEEIRVTMMIGAAVGFELAHQLIDKEDS